MEEEMAAAYALFNQILAMFWDEGTIKDPPQPMRIDKVNGTYSWDGMHVGVKAYRVFSRAKGHPNDMVRVDLTLGV